MYQKWVAKIEGKKELTPNDKLLVQSIDDIFLLKENLMSILTYCDLLGKLGFLLETLIYICSSMVY